MFSASRPVMSGPRRFCTAKLISVRPDRFSRRIRSGPHKDTTRDAVTVTVRKTLTQKKQTRRA